ncbi:dTDP-4-dehydrorhamnose reductase [Labrys monachus]|uniref:dTDP-4-dehydrorhamnose reductase n=1 Tax=Labrys monachus TaxID=217067 RepID=A0ABU0FC31_9HYPH|nr:dTDP-4-dehydrorhamnose reductase [Labrys monachus]MDQ0392172.1 dTDP-4-dehydrorhamnose reductase [Labrys monachus]
MRIAVIGEHGQLASCLRERAGQGWRFLGRDIIDLACAADFDRILDREAPDVLVNAAAYTAVDKAETEPERAFAVNEAAPGALARWCARNRVAFLHVSTDYVFDGAGDGPWREDDEARPLNVYGASKLAGERAVLESGARALILRTAWVHSSYGRNFVKTVLRLALERDRIDIVADQSGGPTSAQDLADGCAALLPLLHEGRIEGLHHCGGAGATTWADFAQAIFEEALQRGFIPRVPAIMRVRSADYPTPARRPLNSRLSCDRLLGKSGVAMPGWRLGLRRTLDAMEKTS